MLKARYENKALTRAKCDRCKGTGVCEKTSVAGESLRYFCACRVGEKKAREVPMGKASVVIEAKFSEYPGEDGA